jgi:hypothetical protein
MTEAKTTTTVAKATKALAAEAEDAPVEFEFDGETYTVPSYELWPLEAGEAFENGKFLTFVRALFGDQYTTKFLSKPRTVKDVQDLATALNDATGNDKGK